MSAQLDQQVMDCIKWYKEHSGKIPDLPQHVTFLEELCDNLLTCLVMAARDLRKAEGRDSAKLYLPSGFSVKGDVRQFG